MSIEYITMGVNETYTKSGQRNETDRCAGRGETRARYTPGSPETRGARPPGGEAAPQKP